MPPDFLNSREDAIVLWSAAILAFVFYKDFRGIWGMITRPYRQVLEMGLDSLTVLVLYAAGIAGLIAVTNH